MTQSHSGVFGMLNYAPTLEAWLPALVGLLVVGASSLVTHRRPSTRPASASFWTSMGLLSLGIVLWLLRIRDSADGVYLLQLAAPYLMGTMIYVGALTGAFHLLYHRPTFILVGGTTLVALIVYPVATLVTLYVACILGLGCL